MRILRDALYNLSDNSGADSSYCRGLIIGVIAAYMSNGKSFEEAVNLVKLNLPEKFRKDCIPNAYKEVFNEGPKY